MKHVNMNPLCDLTPIFKDYEKHLASIEQQHGSGGGGSHSESETHRMSIETQSPSLLVSTKLQQASTFLFHGTRTEDVSEKRVEAASEKKTDPSLGATSASFNFGKKIDSSVLGSLNSGSLFGFSFSSGNSSLFGKGTAQSKPVSTPSPTKALESQAEGGSNECKGKCVCPPRSVAICVSLVVSRKSTHLSSRWIWIHTVTSSFPRCDPGQWICL